MAVMIGVECARVGYGYACADNISNPGNKIVMVVAMLEVKEGDNNDVTVKPLKGSYNFLNYLTPLYFGALLILVRGWEKIKGVQNDLEYINQNKF